MCCWMGSHFHDSGSAMGGSGIPVYPKKIRQNTQNYTQVYFIPEIQRKCYTEYPYLSCNVPYTRFKKPLYTVYPKTVADPDDWSDFTGVAFSVEVLEWGHKFSDFWGEYWDSKWEDSRLKNQTVVVY